MSLATDTDPFLAISQIFLNISFVFKSFNFFAVFLYPLFFSTFSFLLDFFVNFVICFQIKFKLSYLVHKIFNFICCPMCLLNFLESFGTYLVEAMVILFLMLFH